MLGIRFSQTETSKATPKKTEGLKRLKNTFFQLHRPKHSTAMSHTQMLIHSSALTLKERITFEKVCKERSDVLDHINIMFTVFISLNLTILMI